MVNMAKKDGFRADPNLGDVLDMMEGYAYNLWDAVFELVDNSFDSFTKHEKELKEKGEKWEINITFDNNKGTFRISDNAFGMNREELERAMLLAQKNENTNIIGKYGMGLKTAASWLGKHWTVKTKRLGENSEITATVDINKIKKNGDNYIPIREKPVKNTGSSYTIIEVKKANRKYASATQTKAKRKLEMTYQKLLQNDNLVINWKGTPISYKEPKILEEHEIVELEDGTTETKTVLYDYELKPFKINGSNISGRYGIYGPGQGGRQVPHAGLTAFYNNRVVVDRGKEEWMDEIFGSGPGDLARQRLFVKLDVELTPNALKTDFLWKEYTLQRLQKEIIKQTDDHIKTLRKIATQKRVKKGPISRGQKVLTDDEIKNRLESDVFGGSLAPGDVVAGGDGVPELTPEEVAEIRKTDQTPLKISINKGEPVVEVYMGLHHENEPFMSTKLEPNKILVFINPNHAFYTQKVGNDPELYALYLEMCITLALSKRNADRQDHQVSHNAYLAVLDLYLRNAGKATEK